MAWASRHFGHIVIGTPTQCWAHCAHQSSHGDLILQNHKESRTAAPHPPSGKCSFSLPFVSFEKVLHLSPSCHYNCVSLLVSWPMKGEPCVMGERKIYKKRKPGVQCSLGRDYSQTVVSEPCVCGQGDFEWWVCGSGDLGRAVVLSWNIAQTENLAEELGVMQLYGCDHTIQQKCGPQTCWVKEVFPSSAGNICSSPWEIQGWNSKQNNCKYWWTFYVCHSRTVTTRTHLVQKHIPFRRGRAFPCPHSQGHWLPRGQASKTCTFLSLFLRIAGNSLLLLNNVLLKNFWKGFCDMTVQPTLVRYNYLFCINIGVSNLMGP